MTPTLLAAVALLLPAPAAAAGPTVEFSARGTAQTGWSWVERASWTGTGHTLAKLGPMKVKDEAIDTRSGYVCRVEVSAVEGPATAAVAVHCAEASAFEGGEPSELEVTGFDVVGEGVGPERAFRPADGGRLKKHQREFFEGAFRDRDPARQDPLEMLLPGRAVAVGESWDIDLDAVQRWLGEDRFAIDKALSSARVTLTERVVQDGEPYGRLAFKTVVVPSRIEGGEFEEARMVLRGDALLPLRGDLPYLELNLELAMRYLGTMKMKGVKVNLDLDTVTVGYEHKVPGQSPNSFLKPTSGPVVGDQP
jgi:hypothetical protein